MHCLIKPGQIWRRKKDVIWKPNHYILVLSVKYHSIHSTMEKKPMYKVVYYNFTEFYYNSTFSEGDVLPGCDFVTEAIKL